MSEECIYCVMDGAANPLPAVDEFGYCGHHHWAVAAEVSEGFRLLRVYLEGWARFRDWCESHELVA